MFSRFSIGSRSSSSGFCLFFLLCAWLDSGGGAEGGEEEEEEEEKCFDRYDVTFSLGTLKIVGISPYAILANVPHHHSNNPSVFYLRGTNLLRKLHTKPRPMSLQKPFQASNMYRNSIGFFFCFDSRW